MSYNKVYKCKNKGDKKMEKNLRLKQFAEKYCKHVIYKTCHNYVVKFEKELTELGYVKIERSGKRRKIFVVEPELFLKFFSSRGIIL